MSKSKKQSEFPSTLNRKQRRSLLNKQTMMLECSGCKAKLIVNVPTTTIYNDNPEIIVVAMGPNPLVTCPGCGQSHGIVCAGITNALFRLVPVQLKSESGLVIPANAGLIT